jgi:hypothetical protein
MEKRTSGGGRPCGGADRDKVVVAPLLVCRQLRRPTRDARPDVRTRALQIFIGTVRYMGGTEKFGWNGCRAPSMCIGGRIGNTNSIAATPTNLYILIISQKLS